MRDAFKRGAAILVLLTFIFSPLEGRSKRNRRKIRERRPRIEATLTTLDRRTADSSAIQEGVIVRARRLTPRDCREYLGIRSLYNPIQLTIENYGTSSWTLSDEDIGLNLVNYKKISKKLWWRRVGGVFGRIAFGLLAAVGFCAGSLHASAFVAGLYTSHELALFASMATFSVACSLGAQAAVITPVHTFAYIKSSNRSCARVLNYTFDNQIILHPGERVNLLLFVRNKEKKKFKSFGVALRSTEQPENTLTFESSVYVKTRK